MEQVTEWEISGPVAFKSCETQDDMLPNVVVGELKADVLPFFKNWEWCFSNNVVAPREEPILIPKTSFFPQPAFFTACREAKMA